MNKTGIPYLDMTWNPGGCGCSKGCDFCWAREKIAARVGRNIGCEACQKFEVHIHPERLTGTRAPDQRKRPVTVGVQFAGELFDPKRTGGHLTACLNAARRAPQHTYVFLTQQPQIMAGLDAMGNPAEFSRPNWFCGITARDQDQLAEGMIALRDIPHKIWISAEPLEQLLDLKPYTNRLWAVIIGTNNNADAPQAQPEWIAAMTRQCEVAGVCVFVKQLRTADTGGRLLTDPATFPDYLRIRELVWPLAGQPGGRDHYRKERKPHPGQPVYFERV